MTNSSGKRASDYLPFCKDQGIHHLLGATVLGQSAQKILYTMAAGGVVKFSSYSLPNMLDGTYFVIATNTGAAVAKVARDATRTASQFVVTGPTNGDLVEILVFGAIAGALTK